MAGQKRSGTKGPIGLSKGDRWRREEARRQRCFRHRGPLPPPASEAVRLAGAARPAPPPPRHHPRGQRHRNRFEAGARASPPASARVGRCGPTVCTDPCHRSLSPPFPAHLARDRATADHKRRREEGIGRERTCKRAIVRLAKLWVESFGHCFMASRIAPSTRRECHDLNACTNRGRAILAGVDTSTPPNGRTERQTHVAGGATRKTPVLHTRYIVPTTTTFQPIKNRRENQGG